MWRHTTFSLAVDDFGIKYFNRDDGNHHFSAPPRQTLLYNRLVWWFIPWPNNQLKLWKGICSHLHAWLCPKSSSKVQVSPAWYSTTCSTCKDNASILEKLNTQPLINPLLHDEHETKQVQAISVTFLYYARELIPLYCPHSMKFSTSRPNQQKKTMKHADNLWTIYLCMLRLINFWMPVIWFFP